MALNFNLLNTELPGQIATGAMRGYQGAQDRATELAQRQQQSQLNALKISEAQRTEQSQNALNKAYSQSVTPTGTTDYNKLIGLLAVGGAGEKIPAIQKAQTEQLTAQSAQQKAKTEAVDARLKLARGFLDTIDPTDPNAPALYMKWHNANHSDPVLGPELASRGVTAEQSNAQIQQAIAQGPQAFADLINKSKLGTEKFMEMNKMTPEIQTMTRLGYPITQEGFEAYRQAQRPEQLSFEQRKELARAGRSPGTTIINTQEKEERKARGKLLVDQYSEVSQAAKLANKTLPALETQESVLSKGFKTGFGTDAKAAGASVLAALGVENAEKYATSAQTFLAATQQAVLQRQLEQKGPQTEADAQRITQTAAQRSNTVDANKFLIDVAKEQLRRDVEQRNFYDKWYKTNETYDGAEDAWFNGEGAKSLFNRPALKKYVLPASNAPAKADVIGTYSDAAKEARYQQWLKAQGK
jgi:hypothetical protein